MITNWQKEVEILMNMCTMNIEEEPYDDDDYDNEDENEEDFTNDRCTCSNGCNRCLCLEN